MKIIKKGIMFFLKRPLILLITIAISLPLIMFGSVKMLHYSSTPEFCQTCHARDVNEVGGEYFSWAHNIHYFAEVECMDCHARPGIFHYLTTKAVTGARDVFVEVAYTEQKKLDKLRAVAVDPMKAAKAVPTETCLFCHSDSVNEQIRDTRIIKLFVSLRGQEDVVNPEYREEKGMADILVDDFIGINVPHDTHIDAGVNCVDCHTQEPHGGSLFNPVEMNTCFSCHGDLRNNTGIYAFLLNNIDNTNNLPDNEDCTTCHTVQSQSLDGVLAVNFGIDKVAGDYEGFDCVDCHDGAFGENYITGGEITLEKEMFEQRYDDLMDMWLAIYQGHLSLPYDQRDNFILLKNYIKMLSRDGSSGQHNKALYDTIFEKSFMVAHELQESLSK